MWSLKRFCWTWRHSWTTDLFAIWKKNSNNQSSRQIAVARAINSISWRKQRQHWRRGARHDDQEIPIPQEVSRKRPQTVAKRVPSCPSRAHQRRVNGKTWSYNEQGRNRVTKGFNKEQGKLDDRADHWANRWKGQRYKRIKDPNRQRIHHRETTTAGMRFGNQWSFWPWFS